ncbi:ATP-dependent zinc metalloprotease FtsH [Olsenella uli]|uniref:ATP-dependent zinc metalloprotease FtsH n=1 Tax=Olsenella uli TaxID=133926 RepID=UPI00165148E6|nr:ATP-dependent zinc metalloprotease FtsH [Olsenella uli]
MSSKNNLPKGAGQPGSPRVNVIYLVIAAACIVYLVFTMGPSLLGGGRSDAIATSDMVAAVNDDRVATLTYKLSTGEVKGTYWKSDADKGNTDALVSFKSSYAGTDNLADLMAEHPKVTYTVDTSSDDMVDTILFGVLPTVILVCVLVYFMRQMQGQNGQAMNFGKTKAKTTEETRPKVKFKDVAGVDEAVEELKEIRDFLAEPERFHKLGARIPRGVLLVGPPGTGKTLLAKAVAGEAGVPFFSISGSDFVEMFVGVGASRVRDLFKQAKAAAPAIIFIDEIDAVGRQRGAGLGGGHDEREQTLNQLLVEMDGFEQNEAVILIAATNRPDILDPALLRPGRFDRQVTVDRPDVKGREQIIRVHAEGKPLAGDIDFGTLAKLTPGFTGADLMNLMNEAALLAARRHRPNISMNEIEEAMERVIAGPERKSRVMTEKERKTIAYHESGHALVGHVLENSDPVHKISIISRGQALGYTLQLPEEDHFLNTRNGMLDQIAVLLAGRTAEELFCDDITTGASNDLERATKMARQMVTRLGMSDALGTQVFGEAQHQVFLGRDYADHQDYSAETAKRIDDEVERIMREAHVRARRVLEEYRDRMVTMATVLLARETVEGAAVNALLDGTWDEYLKEHPEEAEEEQTAEEGSVEPSAGADTLDETAAADTESQEHGGDSID